MGVNWKHLAEMRGKMVEEYQDVMIPRYRKLVEELHEENLKLKEELMAAKYHHHMQDNEAIAKLQAEVEHLKKLLELARGERDAVTRRMIELEKERTQQV